MARVSVISVPCSVGGALTRAGRPLERAAAARRRWARRRRRTRAASGGDDDRERAVGQRGTGRGADVGEAGGGDEAGERAILEPEPAIVQAIADPVLVVRAKVEDQDAAARRDDAVRLGERPRRRLGVVQGLREEHDVDAGVGERQLLDLPTSHDTLATPRRAARARARARTSGERSMATTCEAQRAVSMVR